MAERIELVAAAFEGEKTAQEALKRLKTLEKEGLIELDNAAVLSKNEQGKFFMRETQDVDGKHGALFGAITGGLIGLLGGPAGVIVGAAAGAATGGLAAEKLDMGFEDDILREFSKDLQPNSSALIALVRHVAAQRLLDALEELAADIFHQTLTEEVSRQLQSDREDHP